jgi:hypothetical protein
MSENPEEINKEDAEWLIQEELRRERRSVLHGEYDSDLEEILSQIKSLQQRVNALEKKLENQS